MIVNYVVTDVKIVEIWSLEEVKNYLRISYEYDDQLIINLMETAVDFAEKFTGLSLYQRQIICNVRNACSKVILKYIPVIDIQEVYLLDKNDKRKVTDSFGYIETENSCLYFMDDYTGEDVQIEYIAGYKNNIPRSIQHGILMHVASMYEHNEDGVTLSSKIRDLYIPYRVIKV